MKLRIAAVVVGVLVLALIVNAFLVSRMHRDAESFGGGRVLALDGPDLNVREYGPPSDEAVVLLHGYSASIEWWEQVAPALAAAGHRVVAIDLVGHGGSEAPRDGDEYGAAGQAVAVERALDELDVGRAVLVGHSMGGHIATAIAERAPSRVERVAVIDTYGDEGLLDEPVLAGAACWPMLGAAVDRFRGVDAIVESSLQTGFADDFPVPDIAHRSLERLTQQGVCHSDAAVELNSERAVADRLAALGKPVLVVWGDRDVLAPTESNVARFTEAGLPPHVVPDSGHSPMVERPDALTAELMPFLAPDQDP